MQYSVLFVRQSVLSEYHCQLADDLSIDPLDCMRLFTNLLDNAIEACAPVAETERFLTIKSRINNHTMILQVTNSKLTH